MGSPPADRLRIGLCRGVLPEREYDSPTGKRVYDLRHTCLTTWLNNGIPPARVAAWADNSVPILLATYADHAPKLREERMCP